MGKAKEWMSEQVREGTALSILEHTRRSYGQVWASCPFCGTKKNTAFHYDPAKDLFYCHSCAKGGDLITLIAQHRGQEVEEVYKELARQYAPPSTPEAKRQWKRQAALRQAAAEAPPKFEFSPRPQHWPPAEWVRHAKSHIEHSMERLRRRPDILGWLAGRGIDAKTAWACRLGFNDQLKRLPGRAWGLDDQEEDGREVRIYLSEGLVIPGFRTWPGEEADLQGLSPYRLRVRRFDKSPKYMGIKGSSTDMAVYGHGPKVLVVESELDAVMCWALHPRRAEWSIVATGSASYRPDAELDKRLKAAPTLLYCYDNDAPNDQGRRPGWDAYERFWARAYAANVRPVAAPGGAKDPGDAFRAGADVRAWLASL